MQEDRVARHRLRICSCLGSEWFVTPGAWASLLFFGVLGVLVASAGDPRRSLSAILLAGAGYGAQILIMIFIHSLGHVMAGRFMGIRSGTVLITATFHMNRHVCDPLVCSKWTHIGRSAGGPITTMTAGVIALALFSFGGVHAAFFFSAASLIVGTTTLLPIPRLDGWVIWGELLGFRRRVAGGQTLDRRSPRGRLRPG